MAVLGNHDSAVGDTRAHLNVEAQVVIEWTRGELDQGQREFLAGLPLTLTEGERLYVHSEASRPARWTYVESVEEAARSVRATTAERMRMLHMLATTLETMKARRTVLRRAG